MRQFEQPKKSSWKGAALGAAVVLVIELGQAAYVHFKPLDPTVLSMEASFCRTGYSMARTHTDTLKLDEGYWVVTHDPWQRIPTCGELRAADLLKPRSR